MSTSVLFGYLFLLARFIGFPLILLLVLLIQTFNFKSELNKLGEKILDLIPTQQKKVLGKKFIGFSIVLVILSTLIFIYHSWIIGIIGFITSLTTLVSALSIKQYRKNLGVYKKGIISPSSIIKWNKIHSFSVSDEVLHIKLLSGTTLSYADEPQLSAILVENKIERIES